MERRCDDCEYEHGEFCCHPDVDDKATNQGDLWVLDETPKWCPLEKAEFDHGLKTDLP